MPLSNPLDILREYGLLKSEELGEHSLDNALDLASGSLPIVALLQEPCNLADTAPFETMVYGDRSARKRSSEYYGCPTLQEIEYHVESVSIAEYHLRDICVFDLNPLLSPVVQSRSPTDKQASDRQLAQSTTWKMIEAEPPKVLLVLTTRAGRSDIPGLRPFRCSLRSAGTTKKIDICGHECLVVYGFHPSVYLRKDYTCNRGWSQDDVLLAHDILRFCFEQAFAYMEGCEVEALNGEMLRRWKRLTQRKQFSKDVSGVDSCAEAFGNLKI
jgi:hypothetical protein